MCCQLTYIFLGEDGISVTAAAAVSHPHHIAFVIYDEGEEKVGTIVYACCRCCVCV